MKKKLSGLLTKLCGLLVLQLILVMLLYMVLPYLLSDFDQSISLSYMGLATELLLFVLLLLLFIWFTDSLAYAFLMSNIFYLLFIFSGALKINFLKSPIVLYDIYQVDDLLLNLSSVGYEFVGLFLCLFGFVLYLGYRGFKSKNKAGLRIISISILFVFLLIAVSTVVPTKTYFKNNKIKYKWNSDIISKTQKYGFVAIFSQSMYFSSSLQKPEGYSSKQALDWLKTYSENTPAITHSNLVLNYPDNVIVLLVESFQDPQDLPWKTTSEVVPTYRKMQESGLSSKLISPVFGGKSVNAEFELLTGFSHIFTPQGSIPYKDFVHHEIPSIAWQLKRHNYTTNVIQVVKMLGYGYQTIYEHLGFDQKFSLNRNQPSIELDPTMRFGSSEAVAKQIINVLENQNKSFVFAFPNSSHAPWKLTDYPNNSIKLNGSKLKDSHRDEVIAYYNAMKHIDVLYSQIYRWAEKSNEKTLLLIVGDHQPALKAWPLSKGGSSQAKINSHTVPYLFWSNYPLNSSVAATELSSMNLIGGMLLELMQIEPTGFFKFHQTLRKYYQAFTFVMIENNSTLHGEPPEYIFEAYQAIQYMFLANESN